MTLVSTASRVSAPFNGGTITNPLTISRPASSATELTVTGLHTAFTLGGFGDLTHVGNAGIFYSLQATGAGNDVNFDLQGDTGRLILDTSGQGITLTAGGVVVARIRPGVIVFGDAVAAPADALIPTSGFGFWLDDTPAATKLMVKAKDSAGTVKAGALLLA
jgi:hypothetical protein